jgi:hypothetical protein
MYDAGWCRCALTIWPGTEAPELFRAHYARLSARSLDGLAYGDVLAGAIILKNKRIGLAVYHSLGVNISGDLVGQRATAFIDDALAWLDAQHGAVGGGRTSPATGRARSRMPLALACGALSWRAQGRCDLARPGTVP